MHDLDAVFQSVSYEGRIGSICRELGLEKPLVVQSMYIFKQARIGDTCLHMNASFYRMQLIIVEEEFEFFNTFLNISTSLHCNDE